KIISREKHPQESIVNISEVSIGGDNPPVIIAGPCSVETREQMIETALGVKEAGAQMLRGCVYKPRTSPYSFQGLGRKGLPYLEKASEVTELPSISEAMTPRQAFLIAQSADVIQIGSRNGLNYDLITSAARTAAKWGKSILLKRQTGSSIDEFLGAAEYAAIEFHNRKQDPRILLCLRGTKIGLVQEKYRNNPDHTDIPELKMKTYLPIIFDPSHAAGKREYILSLSLAAIEYGADGLMIETHCNPDKAWTDAAQQITPKELKNIISEIERSRIERNKKDIRTKNRTEKKLEEKIQWRWDRGA
ncbi:3-deoxy-7-phosphoheptulonate synthase, partial [Candidatus Woesearchaeota archaeon]|nr:3-deoxy-7-phosphoheptulonate synthase [Candidatus Woesearchaeota archaeon]